MTSIISLILRVTLVVSCVVLTTAQFAAGIGTYALTGSGTSGTVMENAGESDGYRFITGTNGLNVDWLGIYDAPNGSGSIGDGLLASHEVRLWQESDQSLVAETVVQSGTADNLVGCFRGHSITSVYLTPSTAYRIAAYYNGAGDREREGGDLSGWQTNEIYTTGGCYTSGTGYPASGWGHMIGPNFGWGTVNTNPARIQSFGPGAIIDDVAMTIAWTVPYGSVTDLAPTYTVSSGTGVPESGSTNDFTSPVVYTVTDWDLLVSNSYTVTVTMTPASTNKSMLTFGIQDNPGVISDLFVNLSVPYGTDVRMLAPTYTVSQFATGNPPSGTVMDFTTPQTYTVTAQDLSSNDYTVIVTARPQVFWPVTNGMTVWLSGDTINPADTNQVVTTNSTMYVRRWPDRSGNGQDATQTCNLTNTDHLVQYVPNDLNGLPTLRWWDPYGTPDAGEHMKGPTNTTFRTLFFVVKQDGIDPWHYMFSDLAGGQGIGSFWYGWITPGPGDFAYSSGGPLIWVNGVQTLQHDAKWHIMRAVSETSRSFTYLFDSYNWTGRIAEWIVYNRALAPEEASLVETYLTRKYWAGVYITNVPFSVVASADIVLAGTNSGAVVGGMWISNAANDIVASFPAPAPASDGWVSPAVASVAGDNYVWVCGTNSEGRVASDMIAVTGVPEPATTGALAVIGYSLLVIRRRRR